MTPTVLVTRRIPQTAIDLLRTHFDVEANESEDAYPPAVLAQKASEKDALVTLLTDRIDAALLEGAPRLRVVANVAVGYDNIDVAAARARNIAVTNTPEILTDATADFAFTLLLAVARRVLEADRYVRAGRFAGWEMLGFLGGDLAGATMGIAGFGRIGRALARRAAGFGMRIIYSDAYQAAPELEDEVGARFVDKATLLGASDYLSLHVPLSETTRHYIGETELAMMKRTAYLINTARGPIVDEAALARALANKQIAGAGLDVFEREPAVEPALLPLENVVLAPHIASATHATRERMALMAAENAIAVTSGHAPLNPVG